MAVRRVAVIGLGPAGAIAIDALAQEQAFDVIRVFERRETAGGCWIGDAQPVPRLTALDLSALASRTADKPLPVPAKLPARAPRRKQPRFEESSVYPYLETNVDFLPMQFSQEPISRHQSERSIGHHGKDTPFRHWSVMQRYVQGLVNRRGYDNFVSYNTTVELAEKVGSEWRLTLRKGGATEDEDEDDYWWEERFDAVVVASGHFWVPFLPAIDGLQGLERRHPGTVLHSKHFRGRHLFRGKRVVVVGASVSAADIASDLTSVAAIPVQAVMLGHSLNSYFGGEAFEHPLIAKRPTIDRIDPSTRTVFFVDGSSVANVDHLIFGTGYSWSLPFLPSVPVRNNRVPGLYQHVVWTADPSLLFVGAVAAGLTFKVYEWQAVLAARLLAGRATLPGRQEQEAWERARVRRRGDSVHFTMVFPDFREYFEDLRRAAGPGAQGKGRQLPPFDEVWYARFLAGHERRKRWWRTMNEAARATLAQQQLSRMPSPQSRPASSPVQEAMVMARAKL